MKVFRFTTAVFGFCFFMLTLSFSSKAQRTAYDLKWKVDAPIAAGGLGLNIGYFFLEKRASPLDEATINGLSRNNIWMLDRPATWRWSPGQAKVSDVLMVGSMLLPAALLAAKDVRREYYIPLIYLETLALTAGITNMVKVSSNRTRPYVYNQSADPAAKWKKDARRSFFSGHTSLTAAATFSAAMMFRDIYPNHRAAPYAWAAAAALPLTTGILRVTAGKHFPTDVLVGYVTGATVGVLVPWLHRKTNLNP